MPTVTLGDETAVTSVGQTVTPPDSSTPVTNPSTTVTPAASKPVESHISTVPEHSDLSITPDIRKPNEGPVINEDDYSASEMQSVSMIDPGLVDPFHQENVQYEESFVNQVNNDFKAIINTLEMDMGEVNDESDGKNLGHLIDLLEEIKRRIDLFKKDVADILGPLQMNGHHQHYLYSHHRPLTLGSLPASETSKPEKPETGVKPGKPETEVKPGKPATIEDKPKPSEASKPGVPAEEKPKPTAEGPAKPDTANKTEEPEKEPTKTDTPIKTATPEKEPTNSETEKPAPIKTDLTPNVRRKRSPYRGFGGPYGGNFLGGGLFGYGNGYSGLYGSGYGGLNSYGGLYGSGYPYYGYNGGWRPIGYGGLPD